MRNGRSLQSEVLNSALLNLKKELAAMNRDEKGFLSRYRKARLHAFELEFLAKFLRRSQSVNQEIFERLQMHTKDLEDRLGAFNETDEMIAFCEARGIHLPNGEAAAGKFKRDRQAKLKTLRAWLKTMGWIGENGEAYAQAASLLAKLETLDEKSLRKAAGKKMAKVSRELQDNVDNGAYDPKKKPGYSMNEVESKVHELRREIRKIPMYASYLKGAFILTDKPRLKTKEAKSTLAFFTPLGKSDLARSEFARLPKKAVKAPLLIPGPFFLAITRYVSELGFAKDWAQNLQRLREAGVNGEIFFDQLDPALKDVFGLPLPFNSLASRTLNEIRETQVFRHIAEYLETQI